MVAAHVKFKRQLQVPGANHLAQHETVKVRGGSGAARLAENSANYVDSAWKFSSSSVERPSTHELYRY